MEHATPLAAGLSSLIGTWHLRRDITDFARGETGIFEGQCQWRPDPDATGAWQEEDGHLRMGGGPVLRATRRYLWTETEGALTVAFEDGRPFHRLGPALSDRHLCPPDTYDVTYDFGAWPNWSSRWHVSGPRKHLTITNHFAPMR